MILPEFKPLVNLNLNETKNRCLVTKKCLPSQHKHVKQQRTYLFTKPKLIKIDLNQCVRQQSHILSIQIGKFHKGAYLKDLKKLIETKEISKKM